MVKMVTSQLLKFLSELPHYLPLFGIPESSCSTIEIALISLCNAFSAKRRRRRRYRLQLSI
jgi:hypothetical protein